MSTSEFFKQIQKAKRNNSPSKQNRLSLSWTRKKIKELYRDVTPNKLMRSAKTLSSRPGIGSMYFYFYDPKLKDILPYYDRFPLTVVIKHYKDGFLGLNLHYLPYPARSELLAALMDITNNKRFDETTKIKASYQILKKASKYALFKPCIKRYLYTHMRSRMMKVNAEDWLTAIFLPVARFEGKSTPMIWNDSMLGIRDDLE